MSASSMLVLACLLHQTPVARPICASTPSPSTNWTKVALQQTPVAQLPGYSTLSPKAIWTNEAPKEIPDAQLWNLSIRNPIKIDWETPLQDPLFGKILRGGAVLINGK